MTRTTAERWDAARAAFVDLMAADPWMRTRYGAGSDRCPIVATVGYGTAPYRCLFHDEPVPSSTWSRCPARVVEMAADR